MCGLIYTNNCYECKYATVKRGSDLTIGDSWGSELDIEEQKKGISLILCQTTKGEQLLESSGMQLNPVDLDLAIKNNAQLRAPSPKSKLHDRFFYKYRTGRFKQAVFYSLPFKCIKQRIKGLLIKMRIIRGGGYIISR